MGLTLIACSRNTYEEQTYIGNSTLLNIKNSNGLNLLNSVNSDNIKLYYKKNGNLELLTYSSEGAILDYPKGYVVIQEPPINEKMIKIFCYIGGNNSEAETFVKWNDDDMDTISYSINKNSTNSISISNIKFNSVAISNNNQNGIYYVVKD